MLRSQQRVYNCRRNEVVVVVVVVAVVTIVTMIIIMRMMKMMVMMVIVMIMMMMMLVMIMIMIKMMVCSQEDLFIKQHIYSIILSIPTYLPSSQHNPSRECFPHGLLIVRN